MAPTSSEEITLHQLYSVWAQDQRDENKSASLAVCILGNGEEGHQLFRIEFVRALLQEHFARKRVVNILVFRAFFVWWTRAEQQTRCVHPMVAQVQGPLKVLLQCAVANAWYKAWNWALEERAENAGMYEKDAQRHFAQALEMLKTEQESPALRGVLQIALKDEPWFTNLQTVKAHVVEVV